MTRHDLYTTIHKAIRSLLFDTMVALGRTAFDRPEQAADFTDALHRLVGFLDEHATHEDEVLLPELAAVAPTVHADLRAEHARLHGLQADCIGLAERLPSADAAEAKALGRRLHVALGRLLGAQLAHLEREEVEANRALWASFDDETLRAFELRIVGSIPAPRMAEWVALMLPVLAPCERAELEAALPAAD